MWPQNAQKKVKPRQVNTAVTLVIINVANYTSKFKFAIIIPSEIKACIRPPGQQGATKSELRQFNHSEMANLIFLLPYFLTVLVVLFLTFFVGHGVPYVVC